MKIIKELKMNATFTVLMNDDRRNNYQIRCNSSYQLYNLNPLMRKQVIFMTFNCPVYGQISCNMQLKTLIKLWKLSRKFLINNESIIELIRTANSDDLFFKQTYNTNDDYKAIYYYLHNMNNLNTGFDFLFLYYVERDYSKSKCIIRNILNNKIINLENILHNNFVGINFYSSVYRSFKCVFVSIDTFKIYLDYQFNNKINFRDIIDILYSDNVFLNNNDDIHFCKNFNMKLAFQETFLSSPILSFNNGIGLLNKLI